MKFEFGISGDIKFWDPSWGLRHWRFESSYSWDGILIFFSSVEKTNEREAESIVLLIFALWRCFNRRLVMGGAVWQKVLYRAAEIASFSCRDLSRSNKHETFWHVVSTEYLYVLLLWAIAITDFPLSAISFTVNSHTNNHFYKHICFKYLCNFPEILYSMKSLFKLKYMLRFFIFKFDLNVKHSFYFFW